MSDSPLSTGPRTGGPELRLWAIQTAIIALFAFVAVVNLLAAIFALRWATQPYIGILFEQSLVVSSAGNESWPGHNQGINNPARLLTVNGKAVNNSGELSDTLITMSPGQTVTLGFELPDGFGGWTAKTLPTPLINLPIGELLLSFWFPFALSLIYLLSGAWVFKLKSDQPAGQVFALFCSSVSLAAGLYFDMCSTHHLVWLWVIALPLSAATLVHLGLVFPEESRLIRRYQPLKIIPYIIALPLVVWNEIAIFNTASPRAYFLPWKLSFFYIGLSLLALIGLLLYNQRSVLSDAIRQQTRILLLGSVLTAAPILLFLIPAMVVGSIPFHGAFLFPSLGVFPAAIAYAILRHRMLNVDLVVSQGLVYSILTLLVTAFYFILVGFLGILLQIAITPNNPFVLAIFILLLIVFLMPAKEWVQQVMDRLFYRERVDYHLILQDYGRTLATAPLELKHTLELLVQRVQDSLQPERAVVFIYDREVDAYIIRSQSGTPFSRGVQVRFARSSDLANRLTRKGDTLYLESETWKTSGEGLALEEQARLAALGIVLCAPLGGRERLVGWLALGAKRSQEPYTVDDLVFLDTLSDQTAIAIENAQILEDARQRAQGLSALQETLLDITSHLEISQLIKAAVERATKLLGAKGGVLYLCDSARQVLYLESSYNINPEEIGKEMSYGEGVPGRIAVRGEPLVLSDYRLLKGSSWQQSGILFGAVIGVPLKWDKEIRGVLIILHEPGLNSFSDEDIWLLSLFVDQVSIALENAWLYERAREQAEQLSIINEVGRTIASASDLPEILNLVMSKAVEILQAEAGSLLLLEDDDELVFQVVIGPSGEELIGVHLPIGRGLAGTVAQKGQTIIVNDVKSDPRWSETTDENTRFMTRSVLAVPLVSRDHVIGVIEVINKKDGSGFDEDDSDLLTSFASQVAATIENAEMYATTDRNLARRVQELVLIWEIDRAMNSTGDFGQAMTVVLDGAVRAARATSGLVFTRSQEQEAMSLAAGIGLPEEFERDRPWAPDEGIVGKVLSSGQEVFLPDLSELPDYRATIPQTLSELAVPMRCDGQVLGVIVLQSPKIEAFDRDTRTFLAILADHAALALTNVGLKNELAGRAQKSADFLSLVAHELRVPMTSIKGYAKLLDMGAAGEVSKQGREFLGVISKNVERMDRLIQDLLDISRIETGRLQVQLAPVPIQVVVDEVIQEVRPEIDKRGLALSVSIPQDLPPVWGDRGHIRRIFGKLLTNAYNYTPEGGEVRIESSADGEALFHVKDTGVGIEEEDRDKIFTPFFRADNPVVRNYPGNGLGLAVVKGLVEKQGGRIWFESGPGVGTTFTFTLPVVGRPDPAEKKAQT